MFRIIKKVKYLNLIFLTGLLVFGAFEVFGETTENSTIRIQCTVFGLQEESQLYKIIVEGSMEIDPNYLDEIDKIPFNASYLRHMKDKFINTYHPEVITDEEKQIILKKTCFPIGIRSKLFGSEGGTRLEISAWKCAEPSVTAPYFYQKVFLNGLPVGTHIPDRIYFNEDPHSDHITLNQAGEHIERATQTQKPIVIPEGKFSFIYSKCSVEDESLQGGFRSDRSTPK